MVRNGDRDKGLEILETANALQPDHSEIMTKLGEVLVKEGKTIERAIDLLEKAIQIDPDNPDTLVALGRAFEKLNKVDSAIQKYESFCSYRTPI